jgi:hypothetical protein
MTSSTRFQKLAWAALPMGLPDRVVGVFVSSAKAIAGRVSETATAKAIVRG